ncbi:MAG TPA: polysaccharide biosynthesis/export family protein [Gemmataceae bacterium]|nr:polysaccharide biosynthesis/export family protein [Gemmataceae bacterium]
MPLARRITGVIWAGLVGWAGLATGCGHMHGDVVRPAPPDHDLPRELDMASLPTYRVAPPDILLIEAIKAVPKPPYKIEPLDVLNVAYPESPLKDKEPLNGLFTVEPDGTINLGPSYGGAVRVEGMSIQDAQKAIEKVLEAKYVGPKVIVSLAQSRAGQRVTGPHLIRPDGTLSLGAYGSVRVAGMTLAEVKAAIEKQLSAFLVNPEVVVEVQGFNSKKYYVILDGGGSGQQVVPLPATGNETVLDAIANVNGLSPVSSTHHIWVARPARGGAGACQVLPVDWHAVSALGDPTTNYQVLPGDRVYVDAQGAVVVDTYLARFLAPIERVLGVTLLGASAVREIQGQGVNGNNGR